METGGTVQMDAEVVAVVLVGVFIAVGLVVPVHVEMRCRCLVSHRAVEPQ